MISYETLALAKKYTEDYVEKHGGGGGGKQYVQRNSTSNWNAQSSLVAVSDVLYVYTDYASYTDPNTGDTVLVPGIKVGDGTSLLSALPFIDVLGGKLPAGGSAGDIPVKTGDGAGDIAWVTPANKAEENNTNPITSDAVYKEIGNIDTLLNTI